MQFVFVSRKSYREKESNFFIDQLTLKYGDFYLIPEGGTNDFAIKGCEEILTKEDIKFDYICCAVGTGGTISGLINTAKVHQKVIGFSALKGDFLTKEVTTLTKRNDNWCVQNEYHFGGYGKYTPKLIQFINQFKKETSIPLDPIYTGKMMFGIVDMIKKNRLPEGSKVLIIHTGGLQGIEGFNQRLKSKQKDLKIL
jgi:1-aminocyclopropane-1-carboxylate deaminase